MVAWGTPWKHNISSWVKTGILRSDPTISTDWPWALLIEMANARRMGNWHLHSWKVCSLCFPDGVKVMQGMKVSSPWWSPLNISTSRTLSIIRLKRRWVPLQRPWEGKIFWRRMSGHPSFTTNSPGGRPEVLRVQRYSGVRWSGSINSLSSTPVSETTESTLLYVLELPGMQARTCLLTSSTSMLRAVRIMRSEKYLAEGSGPLIFG